MFIFSKRKHCKWQALSTMDIDLILLNIFSTSKCIWTRVAVTSSFLGHKLFIKYNKKKGDSIVFCWIVTCVCTVYSVHEITRSCWWHLPILFLFFTFLSLLRKVITPEKFTHAMHPPKKLKMRAICLFDIKILRSHLRTP